MTTFLPLVRNLLLVAVAWGVIKIAHLIFGAPPQADVDHLAFLSYAVSAAVCAGIWFCLAHWKGLTGQLAAAGVFVVVVFAAAAAHVPTAKAPDSTWLDIATYALPLTIFLVFWFYLMNLKRLARQERHDG